MPSGGGYRPRCWTKAQAPEDPASGPEQLPVASK